MNDQEFKEHVIASIERSDKWMERTDSWIERTDKWMENTDKWMENTDKWMERTEEWKAQTDNKLTKLEETMGDLLEGLGWIRGKLEGKMEADSALWGKIAVLAAFGSTVIALLAYFK